MRIKQTKTVFLSTTAIIAFGLCAPVNALAGHSNGAPGNSWDYDSVLAGNVSKDVSVQGTTDITVTGGNGYVTGNASIYKNHTVNVTGDNGATFAYRDNRRNIQSTLSGDLNSNMQVVIIDKDGLFFTDNARLDVQKLVATTGYVDVGDIMNADGVLNIRNRHSAALIVNRGEIKAEDIALIAKGIINEGRIVAATSGGRVLLASADQVELRDVGADKTSVDVSSYGFVINTGKITVPEAGLVAMVGPYVSNAGVISAKMGTVAMSSGQEVTLDMYGDGLVEIAVSGELANAIVSNQGTIEAQGGVVDLTTKAARDAIDGLVNNSGVIDVASVDVDGGKIILSAGDNGSVVNRGTLSTSAGGSFDISGKSFTQDHAFPVPGRKPAVKIEGGDVNIAVSENVEIYAGSIDAEGADITIDNGGVFYSEQSNTLKTKENGTIALRQNKENMSAPYGRHPQGGSYVTAPVTASIQNAVDAINNTGNGTNTITVSSGVYSESVDVDHKNVILNGANAGNHGVNLFRHPETVIDNIGTSGFFITADNVTIDGFTIDGGSAGVRVKNADNATIQNNVMKHQYHPTANGDSFAGYATGDGIFVERSEGSVIQRNFVYGMNDDGIHGAYIKDITIADNVVWDFGNGDEGIALAHASGQTSITGNIVKNARRDAFQVIDATGTLEVSGNTVLGATRTGIDLREISANSDVDENIVIGAHVGMQVTNSQNITASANVISLAKTGARISNSSNIVLDDNKIKKVYEGVVLTAAHKVTLQDNRISALGNGLVLENGVSNASIDAYGNTIYAGGHGVYVDGDISNGSIVNLGVSGEDGNMIVAGHDGVHVTGAVEGSRLRVIGSHVFGFENGVIIGNGDLSGGTEIVIADNASIVGVNGDSVHIEDNVAGGASVLIDNNDQVSAGGNGIYINGLESVEITNNDIQGTGMHGIYGAGLGNGRITLAGNTLTDTGVEDGFAAARFESGEIDLSDSENANTFVNTTGEAAVALQFDDILVQSEASGPGLSILGNTLGTTVFDGYEAEGSFYARIEDGSLLDPASGAPIEIDGTNASYDGIIPNTFGGLVLPVDTYNFIESRLFDADDADVDGRGQIIIGVLPSTGGDNNAPQNFQDFLRDQTLSDDEIGRRARLTILGLPRIGGFGPEGLNNLAPAAGNDEDSAENLANISPQAGGEAGGLNVTCVGDVIGSLASGAVTYDFGGTFEESIAGASACNDAEL